MAGTTHWRPPPLSQAVSGKHVPTSMESRTGAPPFAREKHACVVNRGTAHVAHRLPVCPTDAIPPTLACGTPIAAGTTRQPAATWTWRQQWDSSKVANPDSSKVANPNRDKSSRNSNPASAATNSKVARISNVSRVVARWATRTRARASINSKAAQAASRDRSKDPSNRRTVSSNPADSNTFPGSAVTSPRLSQHA